MNVIQHVDLDLHLQGQIRVFSFLLNGFWFIFINLHTLTGDGGCGDRFEVGSEFWWVDGFNWGSKSKGTGHSQRCLPLQRSSVLFCLLIFVLKF